MHEDEDRGRLRASLRRRRDRFEARRSAGIARWTVESARSTNVRVNPHIFREYDIRGVADVDLSDALARDLGRALGTFVRRAKGRRVALGRDCRLSSPRLHAAVTEGLLQTGVEIVDIGMVPTPMMYFAVHHFDLDGGVQITGSHNPASS
jgi:phosphomannomutase / phosphoglucomutase